MEKLKLDFDFPAPDLVVASRTLRVETKIAMLDAMLKSVSSQLPTADNEWEENLREEMRSIVRARRMLDQVVSASSI